MESNMNLNSLNQDSGSMDSSDQPDIISSLPDVILLMIMSFLSFKDNLKTSVLSRRWRNLCYHTMNIAFNETEFVDHSVSDEDSRRVSFVFYILQWFTRFQGQFIQSFELCFPYPVGIGAVVEYILRLVIARNVKNLVLDFSNPDWIASKDWSRMEVVVGLPDSFYDLTTLESLTISGCRFDPSRFVNPGLLRRLSIRWTSLTKMDYLLSKTPLLESLSLNYCWGFDVLMICCDIKEFVFENCNLPYMSVLFDLPKVDIFRYSGYVYCLDFERMNSFIKEVYLDFGEESAYDRPDHSTKATGEIVSKFLNVLRLAKTLTVCPYLLQVIPECDEPIFLLRPMETTHLVLRTKMHPKEYMGIRVLLANCPNLVQLTLDIQPPNPYEKYYSYGGINQTHWLQNITYECLRKTLKVVVVKNFSFRMSEFNMLNYLIRSGTDDSFFGRGHGSVLERIEVYVQSGLEIEGLRMVRFGTMILHAASKGVQLTVANPCG